MKTLTTLTNLATFLTLNTSTANQALMQQLINDRHRYLIQRYFDNERSVQFTTIGSMNLNATANIPLNTTSATLTASWTYPTYTILVNFSDGEQRPVLFTNGSAAISWSVGITGTTLGLTNSLLTGATSATLSSIWSLPTQSILSQFSDGETRTVTYTQNSSNITWSGGLSGPVGSTIQTSEVTQQIATLGVQYYNIPASVSKPKNVTITVGQLKFQPKPIESIQDWDMITMLPYNSDIPNYFFIYNGKIGIFPIPSTTGNVGNINYKTRVPDMTYSDYTTGNVTGMTVGSTSITGTGTTWSSVFPLNTNIQFFNLALRADPATGGDGEWYPIYQFNSDTTLTLARPVINAPNITASTTYTIGQLPLLQEDFHDMIAYSALRIYFSSIVKDPQKFQEFDNLYKEALELLKDYAGTKQVNVDLEDQPNPTNPNLFLYSPTDN